MTPETLEALKGSIEKWRKIVEEGGEDQGSWDCPLCQIFYWDFDCDGCPVAVATKYRLADSSGHSGCEGSPYTNYVSAKRHHGVTSEAAIAAARTELAFLRSLLPEGETA